MCETSRIYRTAEHVKLRKAMMNYAGLCKIALEMANCHNSIELIDGNVGNVEYVDMSDMLEDVDKC